MTHESECRQTPVYTIHAEMFSQMIGQFIAFLRSRRYRIFRAEMEGRSDDENVQRASEGIRFCQYMYR